MDFSVLQNAIRHALAHGADDAAVIIEDTAQRADAFPDANPAFSASHAARLLTQVGGAVFTTYLPNDIPCSPESLNALALNAAHAAKIADAWQVHPAVRSLNAILPNAGATPGPPPPDDFFSAPAVTTALLDDIQYRLNRQSVHAQLRAALTTRAIRTTILREQTVQTENAVTSRLQQSIVQNEHTLNLPDFACAGFIENDRSPLLAHCLCANEIAVQFARSTLTTSKHAHAPSHITSVVLAPWAAAILAHEASHLGANLAATPTLALNISQFLLSPQTPPHGCPSFAIIPAAQSAPSINQLIQKLPNAFYVDAPTFWIRSNTRFLDIRFQIACLIASGAIAQTYQSLSLRFDLVNVWKSCSACALPEKCFAIPCRNTFSAIRSPAILVQCLAKSALLKDDPPNP